MIKVCIFNKSNDVSRFNILKKFFECVNSKISLTCCTQTGAVYQNRLDSESEENGRFDIPVDSYHTYQGIFILQFYTKMQF